MNTVERDPIFVIDDDPAARESVAALVRSHGLSAETYPSAEDFLEHFNRDSEGCVVVDLRMPGMSGTDLQRKLEQEGVDLPVIIITAFGSIPTAIESMKLGAFDYLTKPFGNDELLLVVSRALEDCKLRQEVRRLRSELARSYGLPNIIATDPKMIAVLGMIEQIADSSASVLITGESGTGKDLIARALHFSSARCAGPFIPINCAAIPESLIESELFGYVKGAFTDARQSKTGLFVAARGGTLFLDEIGEMPTLLQAKLLRAIEDKRIRPLGAIEEASIDVRIVAASNTDLDKAIAEGKFRSDLYYRLATVTLAVPPLRERPQDVALLARHFLIRASAEAGKTVRELDPDALACLMRYRWPGNVRELQSAMQTGVILCRDSKLGVKDLPARVAGGGVPSAKILEDVVQRRLSLDQLEREYVRAVLESVNGNKTEASVILQIDRKTLYRKLEDPEPFELVVPRKPE